MVLNNKTLVLKLNNYLNAISYYCRNFYILYLKINEAMVIRTTKSGVYNTLYQ